MAFIREKLKKGNPYYYIVEGRRIDGRVKQIILEYIGPIGKLKALALTGFLAKQKQVNNNDSPEMNGSSGQNEKNMNNDNEYANLSFKAYRHGAVTAMLRMAIQLGIEQIMDESFKAKKIKGQKRSRVLLLAMLQRAIEPGSKREFSTWCKSTSLPYQLGFQSDDLDSAAFWEAMDGISEKEISEAWNKIIKKLLEIYKVDLTQFHMDYSNYYTFINTTNGRCVICKRGHNKQKRDDLLQFSLAALTTVLINVPIAWQLYDGNRNDKAEFPVFTKYIREQLQSVGINPAEVTISFDGGSNSEENFKDIGFHFVCAHSMVSHKDLYDIDLNKYETVILANGNKREAYKLESFKFSGVQGTGVLVYSEALKNGQLAQLKRDLAKFEETANDTQQRLLKPGSSLYAQLRKRKEEVEHQQHKVREYNKALEQNEKERIESGEKQRGRAKKTKVMPEWNADSELLEIVKKTVYKKNKHIENFTTVTVTQREDELYDITWTLRENEKEQYIQKYYGKKLICTDHTDWTMQDILNNYTDQECIENGIFRVSKDVDHFAIRPQFHWTDDKIRVHVFICLASIIIAETLRKHFEANGVNLTKHALLDRLDEIHDGWIFLDEKKVKRALEKLDEEHLKLWKITELIGVERSDENLR